MNTHDVISAFVDDEAFDANELAEALSVPDGRALLIDLIALRHLTRNGREQMPMPTRATSRFHVRPLFAAAAIFVALVGGYLVGERQREVTPSAAPAPTRIVEAPSTWKVVPPPPRSIQ